MGAGDQSHDGKGNDDGGTAVAEEGQRQADDRHDEQAHAHVGQHLEHQHAHHAHADIGVQLVVGVAGHIDAPQNDGRQDGQCQHAAHHPQLLADDGEDKVRMAVGQAGAVRALGLDSLEKAHTRQLAAAQGQQTAGLLPALLHGMEAVVKYHDKPVFHVILDHVLFPEDIKGQRRRQSAADEPALGYPGHKAHADEDGHKHQVAAHVRGYFII